MKYGYQRVKVIRYNSSKKLAALIYHNQTRYDSDPTLLGDLDEKLNLRELRWIKYLRWKSVSVTDLMADIETLKSEGGIRVKILRVITPKDTELTKWLNTESLKSLPVLPQEFITREEEYWAGKVDGNIGGKVWAIIIALLITAGIVQSIINSKYTGVLVCAVILLPCLYSIFWDPWIFSKKPAPEKIEALLKHKRELLKNHLHQTEEAKIEVKKMLESFENWETLTPREFEIAISLRLKEEGMNVEATQYLKDGGIDIEGHDSSGTEIIVQVKRYKSAVAVGTIREMAGIKSRTPTNKRVIVYALNGFTRGAKFEAKKLGIELRSLRDEMLKL